MQGTDTASATDMHAALARVATLFEQLSPARLVQLDSVYASDARFKDPFNDVQGVGAIARIFLHMYASLDAPRFKVVDRLMQGDQAFLTWEFHFRFLRWDTRTPQVIRGATHLRFDPKGLVVLHRDYWDAAEELYEKLPAVGAFMRWMRRRASR